MATPDALYHLIPVTLKIEDTLFRIPRFTLMSNSRIFQDMFAIPQGETQTEGSSDNSPITLEHVKKDDFRHLLHIILPLDVPPIEPILSKDAWIAVLGLASMWEMYKIRIHCIDKLTNIPGMTSIERIVLAKKFHVPQWLRTAYKDLIDRNESLSMDDSESIGYRSAVGVLQLREQRFKPSYSYGYHNTKETLETVFKSELEEEEAIYQIYAATDTELSM